jgi:hypothetical protein
MTAQPVPSADLEQQVRDYYNAHGMPDELWTMGFAEAVAFAKHFRDVALADAVAAERERIAKIFDALVAKDQERLAKLAGKQNIESYESPGGHISIPGNGVNELREALKYEIMSNEAHAKAIRAAGKS